MTVTTTDTSIWPVDCTPMATPNGRVVHAVQPPNQYSPRRRSICFVVYAESMHEVPVDSMPICGRCAPSLAAHAKYADWRRFHADDFPWPDGHVALVANDGFHRIKHVFDLTVEATPDQPSVCDLAEMEDVESYEVSGPVPKMCGRCRRLLAERAGLALPAATMNDVYREKQAKRAAAHRIHDAPAASTRLGRPGWA